MQSMLVPTVAALAALDSDTPAAAQVRGAPERKTETVAAPAAAATPGRSPSRTSSSSQARNFALGGRGLGYLSNVDDIVVRRSRCDIEFVARNGWFSMTV